MSSSRRTAPPRRSISPNPTAICRRGSRGFSPPRTGPARCSPASALAAVGLPTDTAMRVAVTLAADDRINPHGVGGFCPIVQDPADNESKIGFGQHGGLGANEQRPFLMVEGGGFARGTAATADLADRHRADRAAPSAAWTTTTWTEPPCRATRSNGGTPDRGPPARMRAGRQRSAEQPAGSAAEVFWIFLRLGLTSFGGPVAHLGYFRAECVERRKWLDEHSLRRHRRAVPVPARPGEQPGRDRPRHSARRPAGRAGGLARVYDAVGAGDDRCSATGSAGSAICRAPPGCTG